MPVEPSIRHQKQFAIKPALCDSTLVSGHQQDGLTLRIEGERDSPYAPIGIKAQLLHVGVARTLQRIDLRSFQEWSLLAKNCRQGHKYVLNLFGQFPILGNEFIVEDDLPLMLCHVAPVLGAQPDIWPD